MATPSLRHPCHCCQHVDISNQVAQKPWWGFVGPAGEPLNRPNVAPHGVRYRTWAIHFVWADSVTGKSGAYSSTVTVGRYSGCIVAASAGFTGDDYHGPLPLPASSVTGTSSTSEANFHIDFSYAAEWTGTFDVTMSNPYPLEDLKTDCRELYLKDDITGVPANAWRLLAWTVDPLGMAVGIPQTINFFNFSDSPALPDLRTVGPNIDSSYGGIRADYQTLVNQVDTSGFILGNVFSEMVQGGQNGDWELIGTLYRNVFTPRNCFKSRTTGNGWNGTPIGVQSNPENCNEQDANPGTHTLYREPPDIIISYDNNIVQRYEDPYFGRIPSGPNDPCDCVGRPGVPTNLQAVNGGGVVVLTWDLDPADHDINVDVYRSESPGAEGFLTTWGGSNSYTDSFVTGGHTYYYKLKARNVAGVSDFSAEASVSL